jgi:hypothetical protein
MIKGKHYEAGELHGAELLPRTEETAPGDPEPRYRTGRPKRGRYRRPTAAPEVTLEPK